jgi:retron-type reverse transcriptase
MVFLKDRMQSIKVQGENSQVFNSVSTEVESGVPQGTILGPTLFNIYINNSPQSVKNKINLYANDSKIISHSKRTTEQALL